MSDTAKRQRFRLVFSIVPIVLGLALNGSQDILAFHLGFEPVLMLIGSTLLITFGAGVFLNGYLKGDLQIPFLGTYLDLMTTEVDKVSSNWNDNSEIEKLKNRLDDLSYQKAQIGKEQQRGLIDEIKRTINEDIADELEDRYSQSAASTKSMRLVRSMHEDSILRLEREVASLSKRANLNLVIGVLTTAVAVVLLTYMVLGGTPKGIELNSLANYYIPRISVAVFIEIFSFFFLRLYKSNIVEIKQYQERMIDVSSTQILIEMVVHSGDHKKFNGFFNSKPHSETVTITETAESISVISEISKKVDNLTQIVDKLKKTQIK